MNEKQLSMTGFYSASALLALPTTVIARAILSVCPSVLLSHSSVLSRQMKITIMRFSASGRTIILILLGLKFIRIFAGDHP